MPAFRDLTRQKFGRLTAMSRVESDKHRKARWLCSCECEPGKLVIVVGSDLTRGHSKSCGCLQRERAAVANTTHGHKEGRMPWLSREEQGASIEEFLKNFPDGKHKPFRAPI
jgi:hypothetical protein